MSKPKHTPGPWAVDAVQSEHLHDIILGYGVPGAGSPVLLAFAYHDEDASGPGDISAHEAQANARLIAAAPELLALCKEAEHLMPYIPAESFDGHAAGFFRRLAEAIKKVEGGAA